MTDQIKIGKVVQNRLTTGTAVAASAEQNAQAVGPAVEERLKPHHELAPGAVTRLVAGLGELLEDAGKAMLEAEEAYIEELADDLAPRSDRDRADTDGRVLWAAVQKAVTEAFGDEGSRTYGLVAPLSANPSELAKRLGTTVSFLRRKPQVGKDLLDNDVDTAKLADKLEGVQKRLAAALKTLVKEERERQTAIGRRDDAVAAWAEVYQGVANTLTGLYLLAGEQGAASWLRPTVRKASGAEAVASDEEEETPAELEDPAAVDPEPAQA